MKLSELITQLQIKQLANHETDPDVVCDSCLTPDPLIISRVQTMWVDGIGLPTHGTHEPTPHNQTPIIIVRTI